MTASTASGLSRDFTGSFWGHVLLAGFSSMAHGRESPLCIHNYGEKVCSRSTVRITAAVTFDRCPLRSSR